MTIVVGFVCGIIGGSIAKACGSNTIGQILFGATLAVAVGMPLHIYGWI